MNRTKSIMICFVVMQMFFADLSFGNANKQNETNKTSKEEVTPPRYITIGSYGRNNLLNIECDGKKPFHNIDCKITILIISKSDDAEKRKSKNEIDELKIISQKDLQSLKDSFSSKDIEKKQLLMNNATTEQKEYFNDFVSLSKEAKKINDVSGVKNFLQKFNDIQENTCRIKLRHAESTFERVSENKWVSNPGPQGLCNVIRIQTLENSKEYPMLWKFSEVTVSTDSDGPLCEGLANDLNKPTVYAWDAPASMKFDCKYLEYRNF